MSSVDNGQIKSLFVSYHCCITKFGVQLFVEKPHLKRYEQTLHVFKKGKLQVALSKALTIFLYCN
jgi:hypothetical protein